MAAKEKESIRIRIKNQDCLTGMRRLPGSCIDIAVTSPPYNCDIPYDVHDDAMPWKQYIKFMEDRLREVYRLLRPSGRLCLNVLLEMSLRYEENRRVSPYVTMMNLCNYIGFDYFGTAVWADNHRPKLTAWGSWLKASAPYMYCPFEVVMVFHKGPWKKQHKGESTITKEEFIKAVSGIWELGTTKDTSTPAQYPTALPETCLKLFSFKGDTVLDPFMGSGTTAIACRNLRRNFIGYEISRDYYAIAKEKIKNARSNGTGI